MFLKSAVAKSLRRFYSVDSSKRIRVKDILFGRFADKVVHVQGWTKSIRKHRNNVFIDLNDGSSVKSLQLVLNPEQFKDSITYASSIVATGKICESKLNTNRWELLCDNVEVLGTCDKDAYPFKNRGEPDMSYLRSYTHLRMRQYQMASVLRVRSQLEFEVHKHFQENGFTHIHTPLLTSSDCEGYGWVFKAEPYTPPGMPDIKNNDFFDCPVFLTASSQLHLEACAMGLGDVYTLSPALRAEKSNTRKHLSEFYMLEVELAYTKNMEELTSVIEKCLKHLIKATLEKQPEEIEVMLKGKSELLKEIELAASKPFVSMPYCDAIKTLQSNAHKLSQPPPKWGDDLNSEQEEFLSQHCGKIPLFILDFPMESKPFYVKQKEDKKTSSSVDLILPRVGEVAGGSLREDNIQLLEDQLRNKTSLLDYDWYLDLRRYGNTPHGGMGMGFDRLVAYLLGVENIRDAVAFPRTPRSCAL